MPVKVDPQNEARELHHKAYRDALASANKHHHNRVADIERAYATAIGAAQAACDAAIAAAPKVSASTWNVGPFSVPDSSAVEAANVAFRKATDAADKVRRKAIEKSSETEANERAAARTEFRNSPHWPGYF